MGGDIISWKRSASRLGMAALLVVLFMAFAPHRGHTQAKPAATGNAPAVQPVPLQPAKNANSGKSRKTSYQIDVSGGGWQDAKVPLELGDQVDFHADGEMTLNDGRTAKPAGLARTWTDLLRIYALTSAPSAALIGRIGNSDAALPFLIGASQDLTVPVAGDLYLRANLSPDQKATGSYQVKIQIHPARSGTATNGETSKKFAASLSPALFAKIPRRVHDQLHNPGDMVNFALVGTKAQIQAALTKAGWVATDANPTNAVVHGLLQTLSHDAYTSVPMSTLYLFGRPQDMAYARGMAIEVAATRNHLRLWKSPEKVQGVPMWVGSSTKDNGFEKDQRNGGVTHHIDPDIDQERDFILHSLTDAGAVEAAAYVMPSNPVRTAKTATGGHFESDGRIAVMLLR